MNLRIQLRGSMPRRQRGALLVASLLMLLVMTILGIALLRNTTLDERMALNASLQNRAFQAAEGAKAAAFLDMTTLASATSAAYDEATNTYAAVPVTVSLGDAQLTGTASVRYLGGEVSGINGGSIGVGVGGPVNHQFEVITEAEVVSGGETLSGSGVAGGLWVLGPST